MPSLESIVTYFLGSSSSSSPSSVISSHKPLSDPNKLSATDHALQESLELVPKLKNEPNNDDTDKITINKRSSLLPTEEQKLADTPVPSTTSDDGNSNRRILRSISNTSHAESLSGRTEHDENNPLWFANLELSVRGLNGYYLGAIDTKALLNVTDMRNEGISNENKDQHTNFKVNNGLFGSVRLINKETKKALYNMPLKTRARRDPLPDEYFISLHKKGEREEKHLQNIERDRVMYEKLRLERQLDLLNGPEWTKAVMNMTPVRDTRSENELKAKREKLIFEIGQILQKFDSWKEREKQMKERIDGLSLSNGLAHSMVDKLSRASGGKRKVPASKLKQDSKRTTISERAVRHQVKDTYPNDKSSRIMEKKGFGNKKRSASKAFGYPLPTITSRQFEIPEDWIKNRGKLRQISHEEDMKESYSCR
ncbi:something about silencing, SAS, complex subunit 4-domain-containing protein [Dipodascopsis uninucleata]